MRQKIYTGVLLWSVVIILLALSGCSIEKVSAQKQDKIEYTILKEAEFPENKRVSAYLSGTGKFVSDKGVWRAENRRLQYPD